MLMEMNHRFVSAYIEHMKSHYAEDYSTGVHDEAVSTADISLPDLIRSDII